LRNFLGDRIIVAQTQHFCRASCDPRDPQVLVILAILAILAILSIIL